MNFNESDQGTEPGHRIERNRRAKRRPRASSRLFATKCASGMLLARALHLRVDQMNSAHLFATSDAHMTDDARCCAKPHTWAAVANANIGDFWTRSAIDLVSALATSEHGLSET